VALVYRPIIDNKESVYAAHYQANGIDMIIMIDSAFGYWNNGEGYYDLHWLICAISHVRLHGATHTYV